MPTTRSRPLTLLALAAILSTAFAATAETDPALDLSPTPGVACGPDDLPEATQGRVPLADYESGRAAQGYTCNASLVAHRGSADGATGGQGGYRVHRYTDREGRTCAYYDTTLLFPVNARAYPHDTGVRVLDMTDPENPVQTDTLRTPAMQSPHESFSLNERRGLLGAVFANPAFYHGQFDIYDIKDDCRRPVLKSSLPMGIAGHEGSFTPDGNTYYASSLYGHTLAAIDTSEPLATKLLWTSARWNVHGMNFSDDGNLMYFADLARNGMDNLGEIAGTATKGMTVLDVSEVQSRQLNPQVRVVSHLTWPNVGTPQTNIPITIGGRHYLVEVDEFGGPANVGAARLIDVEDPENPRVVSNMRLAVNNTGNQNDASQRQDPGATNSLGGYRGHYCGVPRQHDPGIVACSFILSGLRVFDIRDPLRPVEIAYFNKPSVVSAPGLGGVGPQGSYAMSQPAFDEARRQIWYTDGNSGFYVVQIENGVW